jgi:hypothetical protein
VGLRGLGRGAGERQGAWRGVGVEGLAPPPPSPPRSRDGPPGLGRGKGRGAVSWAVSWVGVRRRGRGQTQVLVCQGPVGRVAGFGSAWMRFFQILPRGAQGGERARSPTR